MSELLIAAAFYILGFLTAALLAKNDFDDD